VKKKLVVSVGLAAIVASSMTIGAFAASNLQEIKAYLNKDLKVKINGEVLKTDSAPITYKGTTYLPVRAIGEAVGMNVGFDAAGNAVLLTGGNSGGTSGGMSGDGSSGNTGGVGSASEVGHSRANPAPIGTTVTGTIKTVLEQYTATFKVEEVVRGEDAWKMVQQANMFNDEPADGYEYLLAKISVGITKNAKPDATVDINGVSFTLVSSGGKDYDPVLVVPPDPRLDAKLYEGASNTGWAVFQVKTDDANPLLTFGRNYDGTGGVWFKTN